MHGLLSRYTQTADTPPSVATRTTVMCSVSVFHWSALCGLLMPSGGCAMSSATMHLTPTSQMQHA